MGYDGSDEIIEQPVLFNTKEAGSIFYSVSFFPAIPTYSLSQLHNFETYQKELKEQEEREKERYARDEKMFKENPDEFEWIEIENEQMKVPPKVELKLQDAIKYRAGNMIVHLKGGQFEKPDVYVHTLFDEHVYPSGISPISEGKN